MAPDVKAKQSPDFLFASQAAHPGRVSAHPDFRGTWSDCQSPARMKKAVRINVWKAPSLTANCLLRLSLTMCVVVVPVTR